MVARKLLVQVFGIYISLLRTYVHNLRKSKLQDGDRRVLHSREIIQEFKEGNIRGFNLDKLLVACSRLGRTGWVDRLSLI